LLGKTFNNRIPRLRLANFPGMSIKNSYIKTFDFLKKNNEILGYIDISSSLLKDKSKNKDLDLIVIVNKKSNYLALKKVINFGLEKKIINHPPHIYTLELFKEALLLSIFINNKVPKVNNLDKKHFLMASLEWLTDRYLVYLNALNKNREVNKILFNIENILEVNYKNNFRLGMSECISVFFKQKKQNIFSLIYNKDYGLLLSMGNFGIPDVVIMAIGMFKSKHFLGLKNKFVPIVKERIAFVLKYNKCIIELGLDNYSLRPPLYYLVEKNFVCLKLFL